MTKKKFKSCNQMIYKYQNIFAFKYFAVIIHAIKETRYSAADACKVWSIVMTDNKLTKINENKVKEM